MNIRELLSCIAQLKVIWKKIKQNKKITTVQMQAAHHLLHVSKYCISNIILKKTHLSNSNESFHTTPNLLHRNVGVLQGV